MNILLFVVLWLISGILGTYIVYNVGEDVKEVTLGELVIGILLGFGILFVGLGMCFFKLGKLVMFKKDNSNQKITILEHTIKTLKEVFNSKPEEVIPKDWKSHLYIAIKILETIQKNKILKFMLYFMIK